MEATEALALDWYPLASELWTLSSVRGLLAGSRPGISYSEFTHDPAVLYVRRDNGNRDTVVNVFDTAGQQVYSIERLSRYAKLWTIFKTSDRSQIAKLNVGLFTREVFFIGKPEIQYRQVGRARWLYSGLPDRRFYLTDGAPYEWTHSSKYLERIVNPGGGHEETRQRLAKVRLLRRFKFDWELITDKSLDQEVALATAFISMLSQWSSWSAVIPGARTLPAAPVQPNSESGSSAPQTNK